MSDIRWNKSVPNVPDSFIVAMNSAMGNLEREGAVRKRAKLRAALVTALIGTLLLAGAYALTNGFGVLDFWKSISGVEILPQAANLVVPLGGAGQAQTSRVRYTAHDAAAVDGKLSATIDAELVNPDKYILMDDASWGDPQLRPKGSDKSYTQLAEEAGKSLLYIETSLSIGGLNEGYEAAGVINDGVMTIYVSGEYDKTYAGTLDVVCEMIDYEVYPANSGEIERASIRFTIDAQTPVLESRVFDGALKTGSLTIERILIERTPFDTRVTVVYTAPGGTPANAIPVSFYLMADAAGEVPIEGYDEHAKTTHLGGARFETIRFWKPMAELPGAVYLKPWFWGEDRWGEVITLNTQTGRIE